MIAMACFTIFVVNRLQDSRIGRAWIALREDEVACQAMGIDKTKTKLMAFALGATWAGMGGVMFAAKTTFINPASFTIWESINSVRGGAGRHGIHRGGHLRRPGSDSAAGIPAGVFRIPHAGIRRHPGDDDGVPARRHRQWGRRRIYKFEGPNRADKRAKGTWTDMEPILDVKS
jgi:hypothetical protein